MTAECDDRAAVELAEAGAGAQGFGRFARAADGDQQCAAGRRQRIGVAPDFGGGQSDAAQAGHALCGGGGGDGQIIGGTAACEDDLVEIAVGQK